jgi:hypothetical protein
MLARMRADIPPRMAGPRAGKSAPPRSMRELLDEQLDQDLASSRAHAAPIEQATFHAPANAPSELARGETQYPRSEFLASHWMSWFAGAASAVAVLGFAVLVLRPDASAMGADQAPAGARPRAVPAAARRPALPDALPAASPGALPAAAQASAAGSTAASAPDRTAPRKDTTTGCSEAASALQLCDQTTPSPAATNPPPVVESRP